MAFNHNMRRVLIVEPYYGTSHAHLVDGLIERLPCQCELLTMPPRKWKWRMRGGAIHMAEKAKLIEPCDVIFASDFLDLPVFLALGPKWLRDCRTVVYFHENQLTYPVQVEDERDFHFGLTNVTTALTANRLAFNSEFHLKEFVKSIDWLIRKFPDYRPENIGAKIESKAKILPIPLDLASIIPEDDKRTGPLRILWNQRWEFDKAPERLFRALFDLDETGIEFELVIAGESFQDYPEIFDRARDRLREKIVSWGFIGERKKYLQILARCDIVVSTAIHEFFGIAVAEAVAAGCRPLLPKRLAYPEMYPEEYLYVDDSDFRNQLRRFCVEPESIRDGNFRKLVTNLDWREQMPRYEKLILEYN